MKNYALPHFIHAGFQPVRRFDPGDGAFFPPGLQHQGSRWERPSTRRLPAFNRPAEGGDEILEQIHKQLIQAGGRKKGS
jgi:hypothetical protein